LEEVGSRSPMDGGAGLGRKLRPGRSRGSKEQFAPLATRASREAKPYARSPSEPQRCRDSRKVTKPMRAGSPERGQPILPCLKTLRRRRDADVEPSNACEGIPRDLKRRREPEGESALEG